MSECCPRCQADAIDIDPIEGWPVCHACGYLPPEASENISAFEEEPFMGRRVDDEGQAHGRGTMLPTGAAFHQGVGRERQPHESRQQHWHGIEEKVKLMGGQLRLPPSIIEEACSLLDEYRKLGREDPEDHETLARIAAASSSEPPIEGPPSRHSTPVTPGLIGAALYAAARKASLGLVIQEVAQAAQVHERIVGKNFRRISTRMGKLPPGSLRGLIVRHAAQLVTRLYHRGLRLEEGQSIHNHPFMQNSKDLADLVCTLHIAESKSSSVLSAALFELVAEAVRPPPLPPGANPKTEGFHAQVLAITGSNKVNVAVTKKIMRAQLLEFARTLPFGARIHKDNLISFLPAIKELSNTISLIKKKELDEVPLSLKRAREEAEGEGEGEDLEDARVILGLMTEEELVEERKKERQALQPAPAPGERKSTWDKLKGAYFLS